MLNWTQLQHGMETVETGPPFDPTGTQLHLFQDWFEGHGNLQPEECNYMPINTIHSPFQVLKNSFSKDIVKNPTPTSEGGI